MRVTWNRGIPASADTRQRMSEADKGRVPWNKGIKGQVPWNKGIPATAEARTINRMVHIGQPAWNKGIPASEEQKRKISVANIGHTISFETRMKISAANIGLKASLETCAKISAAKKGRFTHFQSPETRAKISAGSWKGGPIVSTARATAKRRGLGYVYLNPAFAGCEGHHVDNEQVINMPEPLHRSFYHRQSDGRGMAKINAIAYNFLFKQEVEAALVGVNP
jgi:hypothetical protein